MGSRPLLLALVGAASASPADRLPAPRPEPCVIFQPELADDDMAAPAGLSYEEVVVALGGVIQTALHCPRPAGRAALALTFELQVGCDGLVSSVECSDTDEAPDAYVACVADVIRKADFPSHDMADGMPITYPVNVAW